MHDHIINPPTDEEIKATIYEWLEAYGKDPESFRLDVLVEDIFNSIKHGVIVD